ncbi:MAG: aspartate 1-decarboxylase [Myxococcota bacterium]
MNRTMFGGKIHRAVITQADLDYEGSITVDAKLLEAADILEHEAVHVWNVTRGTRLQTYALRGPVDSGVICINGAAAHGNEPGDLVIIASFVELSDAEARAHTPRVVRVDGNNRLLGLEAERPGPELPKRIPRVVGG